MTERLVITRAQVRAIAAAAKESGCVVEVERDGTIYRVIPETVYPDKREPVDTRREIDL